MKRKWRIPITILGVTIMLFYLAKSIGILQTFSIPVLSNEPTIKKGDRIWASSLRKPERFSFICFRMEKGEYWEGGTWLMRIVGMPGDTIQILDGTLYVNGQNADSGKNLKKEYILPASELKKIDANFLKDHPDDILPAENDSVDAMIETAVFKDKALAGRLLIRTDTDPEIQKQYGHPWNADNFGPVSVPDGSYFVMGDKRHAAADSRYIGFVSQKKYISTVLSVH